LELYIHSVLSSCENGLRFPPSMQANAFQRHINGICCYDGARLAVARNGRTVSMETTRRAKSSCRQSADALWVNPFKHDLLTSLFINLFLFQHRESPSRHTNGLHHFVYSEWIGFNVTYFDFNKQFITIVNPDTQKYDVSL